jgi:hypothetical protein
MTAVSAGVSRLPGGIIPGRRSRFPSGKSLAERRPLMRSVKGNKALLLEKVTKQ